MNDKELRWRVFIPAWILIYILALGIGILIAGFVTYKTNDKLNIIAGRDAGEYARTGQFPLGVVMYQTSAYVYDLDGNCLDMYVAPGDNMDFSGRAGKLMELALKNGKSFNIVYDWKPDSNITVVIGTPMEEDGVINSVYFFVKPLSALGNILLVLFFALTFTIVLSAVYSALIFRKNMQVERIRREYVANVSHALKSPISSIKALAEVMHDGIVTDEAKRQKYCGIILKESLRLEHTVLNMLELSKLQSSQKDFSKKIVRADELFGPVLEKYGVLCDELGIILHMPENIETLPALLTNASCISELLSILLDNAVKFVGETGNIWIELTIDARHITVCVRDDGTGISKENQSRIFVERFFKDEQSYNSNGSGLGLAIAAEIAAGLGEKLWLQSELGEGSSFFFTIITSSR